MPEDLRGRRVAWNFNHHVVRSKDNDRTPRGQRSYFDYLPVLPFRSAEKVSLARMNSFEKLQLLEERGKSARHQHDADSEAPTISYLAPHSARSWRSTGSSWRSGASWGVDMLAAAASMPLRPAENHASADGSTFPVDPVGGRPTSDSAERGRHAELAPVAPSASSTPSRRPVRRSCTRKLARLVSEQSGCPGLEPQPAFLRFVEWGEAKHTHMVNLWSKLDKDRSGFLHKQELLRGLKELAYPEKAEELWSCLDLDKQGTISFLEFAPVSARLLAGFRRWAEREFGSTGDLFKVLDRDGSKKLSLSEFKQGCERNNVPDELEIELDAAFFLLDFDGRGSICQAEMAFLDTWKCPAYLWSTPDADAKRAFQQALLERQKHNPILAWRAGIDIGARMRVTWEEFEKACKELVRSGMQAAAPDCGVIDLYTSFDTKRIGFIGIRDWDTDSYRILSSFTAFSREKVGRPSRFIKSHEGKFTDVNSGEGLTYGELDYALVDLDLSRDEFRVLFEGLARGSEKVRPSDAAFLDNWDLNLQSGMAADPHSLLVGDDGTGSSTTGHRRRSVTRPQGAWKPKAFES